MGALPPPTSPRAALGGEAILFRTRSQTLIFRLQDNAGSEIRIKNQGKWEERPPSSAEARRRPAGEAGEGVRPGVSTLSPPFYVELPMIFSESPMKGRTSARYFVIKPTIFRVLVVVSGNLPL